MEKKVATDSKSNLDTDSISANLKNRSLRSSLITVFTQPFKLVLGIGSTALLARLLTPADFGLIAMVAPILLLVDSLSNFGLETVVIQREQLNHQQASEIFWLSLKINSVLIVGMVLIAPVVAWFYRREELIPIILVLAVGVLSVCLSFQHKSLLKRKMRFGSITAIEVGSQLLGVIVAITMAKLGWGYWALVGQLVGVQVAESLAQWLVCDWRPDKPVAKTKFKLDANLQSMFDYGIHLTGFRFLTRIAMHLDRILIGYVSGASVLGLYQVAYKWAHFPFEQIYFPLFDVAVSSLSRVQHNPSLYRRYSRRVLLPLFSVCFPGLAFCFIKANKIILFLLGDQWLEAIPLFRLLVIAVYVVSMYRITKWLYISSGQTRRQFHWGLLHTPLMIIAVAVGANWGAYGVAVGYTVAVCLLTYPAVVFCLKSSPLSGIDFARILWRPALSSISAAIVMFVGQKYLPSSNLIVLELVFSLIIFSLTYILFWTILPGGKRSISEMLTSLKTLRS